MNTRICSVDGCGKTTKSGKQEHCRLHWERLRNTGTTDPRPPHKPKPCSIDGCERKAIAKTYCSTHYQRYTKHGDPLYTPPEKVVDLPDGTRVCTGCNERKPIEDYYKHPTEHGGRQRRCKACAKGAVMDRYRKDLDASRATYRERYQANIDHMREYDRARYERDKPKRLALAKEHAYKRRLRIVSGPRDRGITDSALRERDGDKCCYCDKVMSFEIIKGHQFNPDRATIEHRTPLSQGGTHTWDNTVLACWLCNVRRGTSDAAEYHNSVNDTAG